MKYKYIILLLVLLMIQCKSNQISIEPINEEECKPLERLTNVFSEPLFTLKPTIYHMPYFNPNNSDEIICGIGTGLNIFLIKYNLKTEQKDTIYQGRFNLRPRWGRTNWILLNIKDDLGYNIYKIRPNGENLTRLTESGNCHFPEFNINGDKFIYELGFTANKYVLMSIEGDVLDTLLTGVGAGSSWQHEDLVATADMFGLTISNPKNPEEKVLYEKKPLAQSLNGAEWLDSERVFWCHTTGVFITNTVTEETATIKETCNSDTYQLPSYAPDIDKIILIREEKIVTDTITGEGIAKRSLYMMNSNGTGLEKLEID